MKKYLFLLLLTIGSNLDLLAQTQMEMNQTADAKYKKADAELNIVYKQLMSLLDKNEKVLLIQAEKDWIKYRDSHCEFDASQYEGGSIQPLIYSTCLEELTKKRIAEIKASSKERDL